MRRTELTIVVSLATLIVSSGGVGRADPMGTAFTYQGQLKEAGQPADGQYDFEFGLYDDDTGGAQIGSAITTNGVEVSNGLFTVNLDFGSGVFAGDARWLGDVRLLYGEGSLPPVASDAPHGELRIRVTGESHRLAVPVQPPARAWYEFMMGLLAPEQVRRVVRRRWIRGYKPRGEG